MRQIGSAARQISAVADEARQLQCERHSDPVHLRCARCERQAGAAAGLRNHQVVEHGQAAKQLRGLVGARNAGTRHRPGGLTVHRAAARFNRAAAGPVKARQHVEHGGLARAVRADQAGNAARLGGESQATDGLDAAERDA